VRLEGLGKLKKKIDLVGTRSRDLPAYSIVPQPITLPHAPNPENKIQILNFLNGLCSQQIPLDN
jgi:hypothetical protein